MTTYQIPHFGLKRQYKNLKHELLDATDKVLSSGNLINGKYTYKFIDWLKDRVGCPYAVITHSGTQALEIMARYEKDEFKTSLFVMNQNPTVRIPNLTYPATLNAFLTTGWNVSLVDTDKNGLMVANHETSYEEYDCQVGLYGAAPVATANNNVFVDGAQHWLAVKGNVGRGMAISFDPTKNLPASGNGGAILTHSINMYEYAKSFTNNGKSEQSAHFFPGTNSKMSEIDCAHLLIRTRYIDEWQDRRKQIREYYIENLKDLPVRCLSEGFEHHADQKFVIYTPDRDKLFEYLHKKGIEAKIHYPYALSELPIAKDIKVKPDMLSVSIMLSRGVLSLPIYPELTDSEIESVINNVKRFYATKQG